MGAIFAGTNIRLVSVFVETRPYGAKNTDDLFSPCFRQIRRADWGKSAGLRICPNIIGTGFLLPTTYRICFQIGTNPADRLGICQHHKAWAADFDENGNAFDIGFCFRPYHKERPKAVFYKPGFWPAGFWGD